MLDLKSSTEVLSRSYSAAVNLHLQEKENVVQLGYNSCNSWAAWNPFVLSHMQYTIHSYCTLLPQIQPEWRLTTHLRCTFPKWVVSKTKATNKVTYSVHLLVYCYKAVQPSKRSAPSLSNAIHIKKGSISYYTQGSTAQCSYVRSYG